MIVLVKNSTTKYRIVMVCDRFGTPRNGRPKENLVNPDFPVPRIRKSTSKKCYCDFELIGIRKTKHSSKWIIGVIEGRHNHKLRDTFIGNPFMGRMTPEEKLAARRWGDGLRTPMQILSELRKTFHGNVTSRKQIANFLQKLDYEDREELTVTQWSLKFLIDNAYILYPLRNKINLEVEILFFDKKESLRLLKKFL